MLHDMSISSLVTIVATINEVLAEGGFATDDWSPETNILHDTPLDSMGLAIIVLRLEERTGKDPFASGFIHFRTVGELAALYAD
jgi:acyl carrier protein